MKRIKEIYFILFKDFFKKSFSLIILVGCTGLTEVDKSDTARSTKNIILGSNQALVYPDNPTILTGSKVSVADFSGYLVPNFITDNPTLTNDCIFSQSVANIFSTGMIDEVTSTQSDCFASFSQNTSNEAPLQSINKSWDFPLDSDEFYQVNTFYHTKLISERFLEGLKFAHNHVHFNSNLSIPPSTKHNLTSTGSFWLTESGAMKQLKSFANCKVDINAFFSPALDILCYGVEGEKSKFRMVQDPTVIYHEFGHVLVKIMMNQRNITSEIAHSIPLTAHPFQSKLGNLGYEEAGAINEGIADYFSYVMTAREELGEFALAKFLGVPRPLSEDSTAHSIQISTNEGERLSYPNLIHYDPHSAEGVKIEGVHNVGQVVSHYLVALTNQLKNSCSFPETDSETIHKHVTNYVIMLLNETLAEIGDLTGKGSDFLSEKATGNASLENIFFTNLNADASFLWTQFVNPPNFRRFFQAFGKNIFHYISNDLCPQFSVDNSETLLDEYGVLLFKSYEDKGNGINSLNAQAQTYLPYSNSDTKVSTTSSLNRFTSPPSYNTTVNESNRKRSNLIAKEFIELSEKPSAFVIDNQSDIKGFLSNLTFEGSNVTTSEGLAGTEYNNNLVNISPGEIVGVALNLVNKSNSIMGGVQVLANDWDHMKLNDLSDNYTNITSNLGSSSRGIASHSPCIFDDFPKDSEGGVTDSSASPGDCSFITKNNTQIVHTTNFPKYDIDAPQPICTPQFSDESDTKWVSQDFYRKYQLGLEDKDCLNNPSMSGSNFNPNECLIRVLPGASQMNFGKIDPQKTWKETIQSGENSVLFDPSRVILMEVNKWINPGTKFNCRFRVRFSNCSDCYDNFTPETDKDDVSDFSDFEFAGPTPYKIINFQFTVID